MKMLKSWKDSLIIGTFVLSLLSSSLHAMRTGVNDDAYFIGGYLHTYVVNDNEVTPTGIGIDKTALNGVDNTYLYKTENFGDLFSDIGDSFSGSFRIGTGLGSNTNVELEFGYRSIKPAAAVEGADYSRFFTSNSTDPTAFVSNSKGYSSYFGMINFAHDAFRVPITNSVVWTVYGRVGAGYERSKLAGISSNTFPVKGEIGAGFYFGGNTEFEIGVGYYHLFNADYEGVSFPEIENDTTYTGGSIDLDAPLDAVTVNLGLKFMTGI